MASPPDDARWSPASAAGLLLLLLTLAACAPIPESEPPPAPPSPCAEGEARDERDRCVPEGCAAVPWGSEEGALHVAQWGDALTADGDPETPYRTIGAALLAARARSPEQRRVFVDVGTWAEPIRLDGLLAGIHFIGRCRDGVVLLGRQFSEAQRTLAGGNSPSVSILTVRDVVLRSVTAADGIWGISVVNASARVEDVRVQGAEFIGFEVQTTEDQPERSRLELVDVEVVDMLRTGGWGGCVVAEHKADVVATRVRLSGCTSSAIRLQSDSSFSSEDLTVQGLGPETPGSLSWGIIQEGRSRFGARRLVLQGVGMVGILTTSSDGPRSAPCPAVCEGLEVAGVCPGICLLGADISGVRTEGRTGHGVGLALQGISAVARDLWIHDTGGPGLWISRGTGTVEDSVIERTVLAGVATRNTEIALSGLEVRGIRPSPEFGGGVGLFSTQGSSDSSLRVSDSSFSELANAGIYAHGTSLDLQGVRIEGTGGPGVYSVAPGSPRTLSIDGLDLDGVERDGILLDGSLSGELLAVEHGAVGWEPLYRQRCGEAEVLVDGVPAAACRELPRETRPYLRYAFSITEAELEQ